MRKLYSLIITLLLTISGFAQVPQKMSFQAVIRNGNNQLVTTHAVGMKISILQGSATGTVVYTETITPITNANGLVSIEIGSGEGFNNINWANDIYFIKTETDPIGGTNYTIIGTSQILSVPYALYAAKVTNLSGTNTGDETTSTIKSKLGVTTLSGTNTGDETTATIKSKLAIETLSGSNTGDQNLVGVLTQGNDAGNKAIVNVLQQGIGTSTPNASAALEINSTTQGLLPPRMTYAQKVAIASPVAGLLVWCSDCGTSGEIQVYNGTTWTNIIGGTISLAKPAITTTIASLITTTTAISGGNIISDGGATVIASGVCWSTTANPVVTDDHTTDGITTGIFTSSIVGLTPNTVYHVRAYATNSVGTTYGNQVTFTTQSVLPSDADGNVYNTVTIGTQTWFKENLKTTKYLNNDLIGTTTLDISGESTPKYQWAYGGDESNVVTYGRLYTWYTVSDSRNLCPSGWHIPTDTEWTTLIDYLTNNGFGYLGSGNDVAKSLATTSDWTIFSMAGTIGNDQSSNNTSGFAGLPGGYRDGKPFGTFCSIGNVGGWWSSTVYDNTAWSINLTYDSNFVIRNCGNEPARGWSVRCLKN